MTKVLTVTNTHARAHAQTYGDYFLAETIEAQNETNHCLAADVYGKAVGFMSVCSEVNIAFLQVTNAATAYERSL